MQHSGYNDALSGNVNHTADKFKYNGIEQEQALGLNLYEMPLRQYDPAIARWTGIDPVVHHSMSTYTAFDNNPIYWADPSGANSTAQWMEENGITDDDLINIYQADNNESNEKEEGNCRPDPPISATALGTPISGELSGLGTSPLNSGTTSVNGENSSSGTTTPSKINFKKMSDEKIIDTAILWMAHIESTGNPTYVNEIFAYEFRRSDAVDNFFSPQDYATIEIINGDSEVKFTLLSTSWALPLNVQSGLDKKESKIRGYIQIEM